MKERLKGPNINIGGGSTFDRYYGSGAAISFLYTTQNSQQRNKDVGFLFLELKDFYGEENWNRLIAMFNTNRLEFPSYADFKRNSQEITD